MKHIEYNANGEAIADAKAEAKALEFLQSSEEKIVVSTDNFITAIRVSICDGVIDHNQVEFYFVDSKETNWLLHPDADGRLDQYPHGFCDYQDNLLMRLLAGRKPG